MILVKDETGRVVLGSNGIYNLLVYSPMYSVQLQMIRIKTISYGAGNSKFFKTEIGWISDFGRTSASQQKIILWDSGN